LPLWSVVTTAALNEPLSAVKVTGTPARTFPFVSRTFALIVLDPPDADTVAGLAVTVTPPTAAAPIAIFTEVDAVDVAAAPVVVVPPAPPEVAVIVAVPDVVPATNFTVTRPPLVSAWDG
jgi:hypothetical protein